MNKYQIETYNNINKIACPTVSARIAVSLKEALPEFAKNVNAHTCNTHLEFGEACAKYVEIIKEHLYKTTSKELSLYYSADNISNGFVIAQDSLPCVAKADPEWDGQSHYGMFCDASFTRVTGADKFIDMFELPNYDLSDM